MDNELIDNIDIIDHLKYENSDINNTINNKPNKVDEVEQDLNTAITSINNCLETLMNTFDDAFMQDSYEINISRLKTVRDELNKIHAALKDIKHHKPNVDDNCLETMVIIKEELSLDNDISEVKFETIKDEHFNSSSDCVNQITERNPSPTNTRQILRRKPPRIFCKNCEECFKNEIELSAHQRLCGISGKLDCDVCGISFLKEATLKKHKASKHKSAFNKECEFCKKVLFWNKYERHIQRFHSKGHVCKPCDTAFDDYQGLREHLRKTHKTKHWCRTCLKHFDSYEALQGHQKEHGLLPCTRCIKTFKDSKSLESHVEHHKLLEIACKECDQVFMNKKQLTTHMLTHNPYKRVCVTCGKISLTTDSFSKHKLIHTDQRKHKCQECPKEFVQKHNLIDHMRSHTGEKPFTCQVCGTSFGSKNALRRHNIIHTGVKSFVCRICSRPFNQKGNLNVHMKSHAKETIPMNYTENSSIKKL